MDTSTFKNLQQGDVVKPSGDYRTFVVMANYGGRVTAAATVDMTNPSEWELVTKAQNEAASMQMNFTQEEIDRISSRASRLVDKDFRDHASDDSPPSITPGMVFHTLKAAKEMQAGEL